MADGNQTRTFKPNNFKIIKASFLIKIWNIYVRPFCVLMPCLCNTQNIAMDPFEPMSCIPAGKPVLPNPIGILTTGKPSKPAGMVTCIHL